MWVSGAMCVFAAHAVFVIRVLGVAPVGLAQLAAAAFILVVIMVVFAALRPTARTQARVAAHRAELSSRSAAGRAASAAVHEDRRRRLALLEADVLPLLRGIADGTLNPADHQVRERCARHAAALRRALVDQVPNAAGLLAELEPALRAARERGLPLEIQVVGDPGHPGREVARALLAAVHSLMTVLPPQPVVLTVLASGRDTELYVTFERPPLAVPDLAELGRDVAATACWQGTVEVSDTGAGCLEVRWRNDVPTAGRQRSAVAS
jgi:hypothetical protein